MTRNVRAIEVADLQIAREAGLRSMHAQPCLISVLMPVHNSVRHLAKSIEGFLAQEWTRKQLVIAGAASTDGSNDIIEEYASHYPQITWMRDPDNGIADAVNRALEHAEGELIGYLGADDVLLPGVFARVALMAGHVDADAIYFDSYTYRVRDRDCQLWRCPPLAFTRRNLLAFGTIVGLQNIFFRRRVFDLAVFNTRNRYSFDYEFYLDVVDRAGPFVYVPEASTINIFDGNISGDLVQVQSRESFAVARRHCHSARDRFLVERRAASFEAALLKDRLRYR